MAVRGEEVASSIDAQIRESIEKMVAEIHSSVEDVRAVVDQQLKAAIQSVQADVNSFTFLPQIQKSISELQEALAIEADAVAAAAAAAAPAPSAGRDASHVKAAIRNIERGKSQVDVLNSLLEQCVEVGSRAALLILRGETFSGWKGAGFTAHGGSDETIKRFNAAPGLIPELDRVLREERVILWDGANLSTRLGVSASERAVLVPMVIKDKVAAAVYVDAIAEDAARFDVTAIELLVFTTGLLVDTLAIRKKVPSPSLTETDREGGLEPEEPVTAVGIKPDVPRPAAPPAVAPPPPPPPPRQRQEAPSPRKTEAGTVAINASQLREMMASQRPSFNVPQGEEFGASAAGTSKVAAVAEARPAPPPPAPPPPPAAPPSEDRPTTQYVPPPGLARGAPPTPASEDAKKHDEARRFARLLVSEIKLYNEAKVEQGRKGNDLYERLKEDIDRSRQMYDERISEDVRKVSNYFYDELVRILADGNADALGL